MPKNDVTVVIPTIPSRSGMLSEAISSVLGQVRPADAFSIAVDTAGEGSAATRNRALAAVQTRWTAFLDDDDLFLPLHLATLLSHASEDVDVVYSGCRPIGRKGQEIPRAPEWGRFGQEFDPDALRRASYLPVTSLVRTRMAQMCRFSFAKGPYDDWYFYKEMLDLGARFLHVPKVTWIWRHHGKNTSGKPANVRI